MINSRYDKQAWYSYGEKVFSSNGLQNYFVSAPNILYIEYISNDNRVALWNSTGISQEIITNPHTSDITFSPELIDKIVDLVEKYLKEYV